MGAREHWLIRSRLRLRFYHGHDNHGRRREKGGFATIMSRSKDEQFLFVPDIAVGLVTHPNLTPATRHSDNASRILR